MDIRHLLIESNTLTAVGHASPALEGTAGMAEGDGIGRVLDPRPPATIVDGDCGPSHQIGVKERLTGAPSCATIKRNAFVWGDAPDAPLGSDIMIVAHGISPFAISSRSFVNFYPI